MCPPNGIHNIVSYHVNISQRVIKWKKVVWPPTTTGQLYQCRLFPCVSLSLMLVMMLRVAGCSLRQHVRLGVNSSQQHVLRARRVCTLTTTEAKKGLVRSSIAPSRITERVCGLPTWSRRSQHSASSIENDCIAEQKDDHLCLQFGNEVYRASYVWLRDHCRCEQCYEGTYHQSFVDIVNLPENFKPKQWDCADGSLTLTWPDDHVTTYSIQWLRDNAPARRPRKTNVERVFWDRRRLLETPPEDVAVSELREGDGVRKALENIHVYGFTFVSGLDPTEEATREAITLIGPAMTAFGVKFFFYQNVGDEIELQGGYKSLPLRNHTDHTYFDCTSGIACLHCIERDGTGGNNKLVDGFWAAQRLKEFHPEHYETLSTFPVLGFYRDKTREYQSYNTVFRRDVLTGELKQIRFRPDYKGALTYAPYEEVEKFYAAFRALGRIVEAPENELQTELHPGRMVIFDNYRMLHGRTEIHGKRVMAGAFLRQDEIQSRMRTVAGLVI